MKVQCDVCLQASATVICCADEAALCTDCDLGVHAANKLAGKHERLPLTPHQPPSCCDICQEKSGLFFCIQDRALLCRDCDVGIHETNEFTRKHTRMLVSGLRVGLQAMAPQSLPLRAPAAPNHFESETKNTHSKRDVRSTDPHLPTSQTTSCSSFAQTAALETTRHLAPSPQHMLWEPISETPQTSCSSLPSLSVLPLHCVAQAIIEPFDGSPVRTTFAEDPSTTNVAAVGWSAWSSALPVNALPLSTDYLFEDSTAEVPSTPITSQHLSCLEVVNMLKRRRHVDEPSSYTHVAPTFVVPNAMLPPCKQSKLNH